MWQFLSGVQEKIIRFGNYKRVQYKEENYHFTTKLKKKRTLSENQGVTSLIISFILNRLSINTLQIKLQIINHASLWNLCNSNISYFLWKNNGLHILHVCNQIRHKESHVLEVLYTM